MSIISPTNKSSKNGTAKKRWLLILALFIIFFNLIFFIWLFTGEKNSYYNDQDEDGFGNLAEIKKSKIKPWGYVSNHDDTDDNDPCIPDSTSGPCFRQNPPPPPPSQDTASVRELPSTTKSCPTLKKNIGDPCSDNDENTQNDKVESDCVCRGNKGEILPVKDGDGDGDKVSESKDKCPNREGTLPNGCPKVEIKTNGIIYKDQDVGVELDKFVSLNGDIVKWSVSASSGSFVNPNSVKTTLRMSKPGLHTIQIDVNGSTDGFKDSDSKKICVQYSKEELIKIINKAKIKGKYDPGTFIPSNVKADAEEALQTFLDISAPGIQIRENSTPFGEGIEDFILAKIMEPGSYLNNISVVPTYNTTTCKVEKISFNLK
jgi:hypothetical protein